MKRKKGKKIVALLLAFALLLSGCGTGKSSEKEAEPLQEVNEIPEDGIITKAQFKTVAGEKKDIQFTGKTDSGITYTWTFHADQIQNPEDQNLKIDFTEDGLEEVKKEASNAQDALKMTMHGKGIIAVPTLTVTLPKTWESNAGTLVKEQGDKLARISDVTIETEGEGEEGTTTLTMTVNTLDGDSYIVGGITKTQNGDMAQRPSDGTGDSTKAGEQTTDLSDDGTVTKKDNNNAKTTESEGKDVKTETTSHICTISINCATLLDNMDVLPEEKHEFVPTDGVILAASEVEFEEGESVHDVLKKVCKAAGIHMESSYTPVYDSAYVEGINQLYEFDGGELSGWMYKVNGWFPNYGVSKYEVADGDVIEFVYTCNLGKDVGDNSMY